MGIWRSDDPLQIIAFQSYGTAARLYARGRALEDEDINLESKNAIALFLNSWKRFETDEIRNTPLLIQLPDGRTIEGNTDADGYYLIDQKLEDLQQLINEEGWLNYEISYQEGSVKRRVVGDNRFPGEILIPGKNAAYGVISDIDDTILHTGVTSYLKWQVIFNTLFTRVVSRKALKGAAKLYHRFHRGPKNEHANPIFYVSHSPWNLYRYLELFLRINDFPKGPILLRSMADVLGRKRREGKPHKQQEIQNILKTYPDLKFVLIGDSGEKDADIYLEISRAYPERILAIYLRSVNHRGRMRRVTKLIAESEQVPVLLANSSEEVLNHARGLGLL